MEIFEKVATVRKAVGLNKKEFAKDLHISPSYVTAIEAAKRNPSDSLLDLIMAKYGVSELWWEDGEGEILKKNKPQDDPIRGLIDSMIDRAYGERKTEAERLELANAIAKIAEGRGADSR